MQADPKYKKQNTVPTRNWVRGFERRFKGRFSKVKTCVLGKDHASRAKASIRDAIFANFVKMIDDLKSRGLITDEHLKAENWGNHVCNADEVGGREAGKRKKVYRGSNKKRKVNQCKQQSLPAQQKSEEVDKVYRNVHIGDDHNPFHASKMFLTFGNGIFSNVVFVLHSSPGSKNPRQSESHKENLHPDWCEYTTTNGSMTRESFEVWCEYLVSQLRKKGYCKKDHPLILLLDGHQSR